MAVFLPTALLLLCYLIGCCCVRYALVLGDSRSDPGLEADGTPSVNLRDKLLWNGKGAGWMAGRYSSAGMRAVSRPNIIAFAGILSLAFPEITSGYLSCHVYAVKRHIPPVKTKGALNHTK
ncbi:uncharacterized protein F5147DRAFT_764009 [Suillus discolor]|uniref:Uncharacterized protein n=1 Tax=Suillus discolor TaxID=1912936 RepID=A0A9P7JNQ5_9AGAM|nr:uncharacterized protein F5147DRAFT_764009 [Suillus discolor]KAG2093300.1 hypothetical protein F5147DRAFT_764009 [Suillus discolor]